MEVIRVPLGRSSRTSGTCTTGLGTTIFLKVKHQKF